MAKVAIIGAGSIIFCKTLMLDIMATPGLEGTEFALMAPSTRRTAQVEAFAQRVIRHNQLARHRLGHHRPPRGADAARTTSSRRSRSAG